MRSAAFVQLGCIGLHPAPNAAGIHPDTTFGQQFGDVLVGERIPEIPAHAQTITSPGCERPLNGLCELIGMEFYPIRMPAPKFATEPSGALSGYQRLGRQSGQNSEALCLSNGAF
jgi:hypothetical protein